MSKFGLLRRGERWFFQIRIPAAAQAAYGGRKFIKRALHTSDRREAITRASVVEAQCREEFQNRLRGHKAAVTAEDIMEEWKAGKTSRTPKSVDEYSSILRRFEAFLQAERKIRHASLASDEDARVFRHADRAGDFGSAQRRRVVYQGRSRDVGEMPDGTTDLVAGDGE